MKILGIISQTDLPKSPDGSAALIMNHKIVYAPEQQERLRDRGMLLVRVSLLQPKPVWSKWGFSFQRLDLLHES